MIYRSKDLLKEWELYVCKTENYWESSTGNYKGQSRIRAFSHVEDLDV